MKTLRFIFFLALCISLHARSETVDLDNNSFDSGTDSEVEVKTDSDSIDRTHLPDHVQELCIKEGYKSSQCNWIYYNPNVTYVPPVKADGTSYPNVDFYAAPENGFDPDSARVNLSTSFKAHGNDTPQAAYYYQYTGAESYTSNDNVDNTTPFYNEHNENIAGKFIYRKVEEEGPAARQNFANWFSYYRVRIYESETLPDITANPPSQAKRNVRRLYWRELKRH